MTSNDTGAFGRRRRFCPFSFRGAHYRYSCSGAAPAESAVPNRTGPELVPTDYIPRRLRSLRLELERYIGRFPEFGRSLAPLGRWDPLPYDPPESALRMHRASLATLGLAKASAGREETETETAGGAAGSSRTGGGIAPVGPMAAVAGTFAELAMEAALSAFNEGGADPAAADVVVENGGDIVMQLNRPLIVALFVGTDSPFSGLAFRFEGDGKRKAVCSSSGRMGHSLSFGHCELAAVFSSDAALADAAATALCNSIRSAVHMEERLNDIVGFEGIDGAVVIFGKQLGRAGAVPEIVRHRDPELGAKISRDPQARL